MPTSFSHRWSGWLRLIPGVPAQALPLCSRAGTEQHLTSGCALGSKMARALLLVLSVCASARDLLEEAEAEERGVMSTTAFALGGESMLDGLWAAAMAEVRLGEDGVEDEVLPVITVRATEAELQEAPGAQGMEVLRRKQFAGLRIDVLESQLVVAYGMESPADRRRRESEGIMSAENKLASELACRPINGTAMFMLVRRKAVDGSPQLHELAFFDGPLWESYVDYMARARDQAHFFGGPSTTWAMKIHWNVLPREQRVPWQLWRAEQAVVARPKLLSAAPNVA